MDDAVRIANGTEYGLAGSAWTHDVATGYEIARRVRSGSFQIDTAHHTASIDLDFVLAGSVVMGLGDGDHTLETGDAVVMNGVGHSWTTGPAGLAFLLTRIGTCIVDETPTR